MGTPRSCYHDHSNIKYGCLFKSIQFWEFLTFILCVVLTEAYSDLFQRVIKAELIKAGSSIEDANIASVRQRFFESRTNTMVNTPDISPSLPQSPIPYQLRNVTFPSSPRNDNFCKISTLPEIQEEPRKQNMTALSLDILRHMEKLQSLINSVKDNEILEIVRSFSLSTWFNIFLTVDHRKFIPTRLKVRSFPHLSLSIHVLIVIQERFKIFLLLRKMALDL
jgi:hypothetical protein